MNQTLGIELSGVESRILDIPGLPAAGPWYVAYSGGLDSTVLLHLLSGISRKHGARLVALHADHRLQPASAQWRQRCERQCREWDVECRAAALNCDEGNGGGPEAQARDARYRWFNREAGDDAWLFTAHHRDDQEETLIERLSRGSGPRGLRGMLPVSRIAGLHVVRPLLEVPRAGIQAYAEHHGLAWVDDDSNRNPVFTRNFIRSRVLPVLRERWPRIDKALGRTAAAMADAQTVLDDVAAADLATLDPGTTRGDASLSIQRLLDLAPARQRNVLRYWISRETGTNLGLPRLARITRVLAGENGSGGGLQWPPVDLRPYRDRLYLVSALEPPCGAFRWNLSDTFHIHGRMALSPVAATGRGLEEQAVRGGVTVRFRLDGDTCRLSGRAHRKCLKKIFQDAAVPPWQRSRIPLIVVDGEIAAIGGLAYCEPFVAGADHAGIEIEVTYS